MNQLEMRILKNMVPEILALAIQYHVGQFPNRSPPEQVKAGAEIYLAPELIEQAIKNIQRQRTED